MDDFAALRDGGADIFYRCFGLRGGAGGEVDAGGAVRGEVEDGLFA